MPVQSAGALPVTVNVPMPVPVQTKKKPPQISAQAPQQAPVPAAAPQAPTDALMQQALAGPVRPPITAMILPWAPKVGPSNRAQFSPGAQQFGRPKKFVPPDYPAETHLSKDGMVNPEHLTSTVRSLAQQTIGTSYKNNRYHREFVDRHTPQQVVRFYEPGDPLIDTHVHDYENGINDDKWNNGEIPHSVSEGYTSLYGYPVRRVVDKETYTPPPNPYQTPRKRDISLAPILADALQDAGVQDEGFLQILREGDIGQRTGDILLKMAWGIETPSNLSHLVNPHIISPRTPDEELQHQWESYKDVAAREAVKNNELIAITKVHHQLLGKDTNLPPGYLNLIRGGGGAGGTMRGTPPPGVIWFKPASRSGRWFHPEQENKGRPLTVKEYRQLIEDRRAAKRAAKAPPAQPPEEPPPAAEQMSRNRRRIVIS